MLNCSLNRQLIKRPAVTDTAKNLNVTASATSTKRASASATLTSKSHSDDDFEEEELGVKKKKRRAKTVFPCEKCHERFYSQDELNEHVEFKHTHKCDVCQKTFTRRYGLVKHRRNTHNLDTPNEIMIDYITID